MQPVQLSPVPSEKLLGPGHGPSVWPLRERLALASALLDADNQQASWPGISRQLTRFTTPGRPESWCSARACAKQYALLLDAVELTRRQKTPAELSRMHILHAAPSAAQSTTPGLSVEERLVKRLTAERVDELRNRIRLGQKYYSFLKQFLIELESGKLDAHVPKLRSVVGLRTGSPAQASKLEPSTNVQSNGQSANTCDAVGLVNEFTQLWHEIDSMYTVPESTWICPPGPGAATTAAAASSGAKSTGAGSGSRLSTLLAEASSAMQTPSHRKTLSTERKGRRGTVGSHLGRSKPHVDSTATTRAAVATRQRYLASATKKQRMAFHAKAKRGLGRSRKDSALGSQPRLKASDRSRSNLSKSGSNLRLGDSGDETTDEYCSSDLVDAQRSEYRGSKSAGSTPSTAAMCASDTEELLMMVTMDTEGEESAEQTGEGASTRDEDGTSLDAVSSLSDRGQTVSTHEDGDEEEEEKESRSDQFSTMNPENEALTPGTCDAESLPTGSPSSQATEAASHQDADETKYLAGESNDTLIANSPPLACNEAEGYLDVDENACSPQEFTPSEVQEKFESTLSGMVSSEEQSRVNVESVTETELIQPTTSENSDQLVTMIDSNEPFKLPMSSVTATQNDVAIMVSSPVQSNINEVSPKKHSPLGSPAVVNRSPRHPGPPDLSPPVRDNVSSAVRTPIIDVGLKPSVDFNSSLPSDDANQTELQPPSDQSGDSHTKQPSSHTHSSILQSEKMSSFSKSIHQMSSSDESGEDTRPVKLPSLAGSVMCLSPRSHGISSGDSTLNAKLSPSTDQPHATEPISNRSSSPSVCRDSPRLEVPEAYRDVSHVPSSSTPSGKELTIELSPANLSHLAVYNSSVLSESSGFPGPASRDDGDCASASESKPRSRPKSKWTKKNRGRKHRRGFSGEEDASQLLSLSKGSPVVELSNLMLPMASSPESVRPTDMSLNLHATVALEPINLSYPSEYTKQSTEADYSHPVQSNSASSRHPGSSPAHPSIRIRLYRHGSQLAVASDSQSSPHSDWVAVFDEGDGRTLTSWSHKLLSEAELALNDFRDDYHDPPDSEKHISAQSDEDGRVAVQAVFNSIRLQVRSGQITDKRSLTHRLMDSLARLVMTHSSHNATCRLARHVFESIESLLPNYHHHHHNNNTSDCRSGGGASTTVTRQRPSPEPAVKRARKKARLT